MEKELTENKSVDQKRLRLRTARTAKQKQSVRQLNAVCQKNDRV